MESKNVWQQILGRKNLGSKFFWMKIRGAKWGTIFFGKKFSWQEILGSMFWRSRFFWGENFACKIFGEFLRVKSHSGEEKNTGEQKCFGGKIWGAKNFESKFLPLMVSP